MSVDSNGDGDTVPTFDDLAIDENLTSIERVEKYSQSTISLQRLVHVKLIGDLCSFNSDHLYQTNGFTLNSNPSSHNSLSLPMPLPGSCCLISADQITTKIIPVMKNLVNDREFVVRQHLALQIPYVARALAYYDLDASGGNLSSLSSSSSETDSPGRSSASLTERLKKKSMLIPGVAKKKESSATAAATGKYYRMILDELLPLIQTLLSDLEKTEVRSAAIESLIKIMPYIKASDHMEHVLSIVITLSLDVEQKDLRIVAALLLSQLAPFFGAELCKQFVAPEWISLSEDQVFQVRRAAAINFPGVLKAEIVFSNSQQLSETSLRLLNEFIRLCQDTNFVVRKACAEALVDACMCLPPSAASTSSGATLSLASFVGSSSSSSSNHQTPPANHAILKQLGPFFELFCTKDESKFVKSAALLSLGRFLSILRPNEDATRIKVLLPIFFSMSDDKSSEKANEIRFSCAYNFPAVVLVALGGKKWTGSPALASYTTLSKDQDPNIRYTVACTLPEIAKVIGSKLTVSDLLPIFDSLMSPVLLSTTTAANQASSTLPAAGENKDTSAHMGIVKNISEFLAQISDASVQDTKAHYINTIVKGKNQPSQWRFRLLIATQLKTAAQLHVFSADVFHKTVYPCLLLLLDDPVSEVVTAAVKAVGPIIVRFVKEKKKPWAQEVLNFIIAFHSSALYSVRQKYVMICESLFIESYPDIGKGDEGVEYLRDAVNSQLLTILVKLLKDPTQAVKLRLAKAFASAPLKIRDSKLVKDALVELKNSKSKDIAIGAGLSEAEYIKKNNIPESKAYTAEEQKKFAEKSAIDAHNVLSKPTMYAGGGGGTSKNIDDIPIEEHILMAARAMESIEEEKKRRNSAKSINDDILSPPDNYLSE